MYPGRRNAEGKMHKRYARVASCFSDWRHKCVIGKQRNKKARLNDHGCSNRHAYRSVSFDSFSFSTIGPLSRQFKCPLATWAYLCRDRSVRLSCSLYEIIVHGATSEIIYNLHFFFHPLFSIVSALFFSFFFFFFFLQSSIAHALFSIQLGSAR